MTVFGSVITVSSTVENKSGMDYLRRHCIRIGMSIFYSISTFDDLWGELPNKNLDSINVVWITENQGASKIDEICYGMSNIF